MGKGRDKRKKQKGSVAAGHGAAKTERKTAHNEAKKDRCQISSLRRLRAGVLPPPSCPVVYKRRYTSTLADA